MPSQAATARIVPRALLVKGGTIMMIEQAQMTEPPLVGRNNRHLPLTAAFDWLVAGWRNLWRKPLGSLTYGMLMFAVSLGVVWGLLRFHLDYILFPAIAGFMVTGPLFALGLYQKSRDLEEGQPVSFMRMIMVRAASGSQLWFTGVILCGLMLLWMRSAVIIYALFFGLNPFPGVEGVVIMLFTTLEGWALLVTGICVGGLFASFGFAISMFAVPMLLAEETDCFTAMGTSMSLVWNNLPVMLVWGAIVVGLFILCFATGFLGMIVIFPLLGHASWHCYKAIR
ncbi:hypothetical protein ACI0FR_01595 [Paenochrobactrum sp. BZR 201-1]